MSTSPPPNRCRIVLIAPEGVDAAAFAPLLEDALLGGDVASLILPQYGLDDDAFQDIAERAVALAQPLGVAVIIAGDSRTAGRSGADGVHVDGSRAVLDDALDRLKDKMIVGAGGAKTRDDALNLGEAGPDYVFFGRFGYDNTPEPHPRNLTLGRWWGEMIQVPCIVLAGTDIESTATVAATGVDFVALSRAVFAAASPADAVRRANAILDDVAPPFGD